ncbi:MAG: transcription termination/antitermination protein NusA [Chloroflexi bacterium]|nr:transcription termination/antitermination protein NusA [Chloroflexota bacterium]
MRSDLRAAMTQIAADRGLSREIVLEVLENALKAAYRRSNPAAQNQNVRIDMTGEDLKVFIKRTVVEDVEDEATEIGLDEARRINPRLKLGDEYEIENTPKDFGRIAAQTTKQVLLQGFRERERDHVFEQFVERENDIVNGTIQRIDSKGITVELEPRAEALMPPQEQVPTERYRMGQKIKVYLLEVQKNHRGPQLIVSRTHRNLLRRLFEIEVPEIYTGSVEIKSIAREPGLRSKVAVAARQEGVDPVGSCVGMRGVRIQNIVNELYGEKIDVLPWDADMAKYIANALSPAQVVKVELDEAEKSALVLVPQNQLSLAIGKEGQNARLAAKLTGWRIDIKPVTAGAAVAAASAGYGSSHDDDAFARLARAALNREREREEQAEQNLNSSFAKAARAAGFTFNDDDNGSSDTAREEPAAPEGNFIKVRKDGTFTYKGATLGPLPPHVADQTVQLVENARGLFVMMGDEMVRGFRRDEFENAEEEEPEPPSEPVERDSRKVRKDGMVVFRNQSFGPLDDRYIGQTVEVELNGDHLDVFDAEGALLDSFLYAE